MSTALGSRIGEMLCSVRVLIGELPLLSVSADDVVVSRALVDAVELLCTQTVTRYGADGSYVDDGFRNLDAFMALRARTSKSEGNARQKRGLLLDTLPLFAAAALAGTITSTHVQYLAGAVTGARVDLAVRDEHVLVAAAVELDATAFRTVLLRWAALCDDELGDPTADDERHAKRGLQLRQLLNGMWSISGLLDPLTGQAVEAAIEAAMGEPSPGDERSFGQLRHDALGDIARESLANDDRPATPGPRPAISLVVNSSDGSAHTPNSWYVSSLDRGLMMCDCVMTAVKTLNGDVFDVGTPTSTIPTRNRKAIVVRDRCCRFPGCSQPARWTEVHHILERENGGCHQLNNLLLLCRFHHRYVHRQSVKLRWASDGVTITAEMRNGTILHGPPHPTTFASLFTNDHGPPWNEQT
jgi:Domain of unknown function (DUF222)